MPQNLESDFHQAMLSIYDSALKLKPPYRATYFLQMLGEHGGRRTADILLAANNPAAGFTELFFRGHLHLSVEYLVLMQAWQQLFTPEQLAIARRRLNDVKCPLPPGA